MKKYVYSILAAVILSLTAFAQVFIIEKNSGITIELPVKDVVEMSFRYVNENFEDKTPECVDIIDLGLSVNWASVNLGAEAPEEPGYLIAWGELEEKDWYSWSYYKFGDTPSTLTKYNLIDEMNTLLMEDDAAKATWGGEWRMPTREEFQELVDNCEIDFAATENGYPGVRFTSKVPGYEDKSIFLCAAGWIQDEYHMSDGILSSYWTNLCAVFPDNISMPEMAFAAEFWKDGDYANKYFCSGTYKCLGRPIRAVQTNENYTGPIVPKPLPTFAGNVNVYLNTNNQWSVENSWFAANVVNENDNTSAWVTMTDNYGYGIYECLMPEGEWTNIYFAQFANDVTEASLDAATNKTAGLFFDGTNNQCNILAQVEDGSTTTEWVVFTEPVIEPTEPEYVDLGLSVNWAAYNVGASTPEENGYFVSWGELEEKEWYSWSYYKFGNSKSALTKYCNSDKISKLESEDDIASVTYGSNWRTPSKAEFQELVDYCNVDYSATENGVPGVRFTSKVPGYEDKSIFFPAGGYKQDGNTISEGITASLWCNECVIGGFISLPEYAFSVDMIYDNSFSSGNALKVLGRSVRAVTTNEDYTEPIIPEPLPTFAGNVNVYLNTNNQWSVENSWFAANVVNENDNTSAWVTMTDNYGYGIYECLMPEGEWTNIYFAQFANDVTEASLDAATNKTAGLFFDGTNNQCNILSAGEDGLFSAEWVVYTEPLPTFNGNVSIYLNPADQWSVENAWFAAYLNNANTDTNAWVTLADSNNDGIFEGSLNEGEWTSICFAQFATEITEATLDAAVNKTTDLFFDGTNNQCNILSAGEDGLFSAEWVVYTKPLPTFNGNASIYLNPADQWSVENAWFAAYLNNANTDTNAWVTLADSNNDGIFEGSLNEGEWTSICFAQFATEITEATLDAAVNKTTDLFFDGTNNQCNILSAGEDGLFSAEWVVYTEPVVEPNEPEYVDLGLSVNWATYNVGASAPEKNGYFVSWGETQEKDWYSWSYYAHGTSKTALTKYCKTDKISILEVADDAASVVFGTDWRTPTKAEWQELIDNCTIDYTATENGVNGVRLTSNIEGYTDKSIFLPYGGYKQDNGTMNASAYAAYWTSECLTSGFAGYLANAATLSALGSSEIATHDKCYGRNVRAVKAKEVIIEPLPTFNGNVSIYLNPADQWSVENAWFAAFLNNANTDSNAWVTLADSNNDGIFEGSLNEGEWTSICFAQFAIETTEATLDAAVNKTTDLFFDGTNNQCNILSAGEDGLFSAEWVVYTEPLPTFNGNASIYLNPADQWSVENAWFAAYLNNANTDTNAWVTLADSNNDGIFEGSLNEGEWTSICFAQFATEITEATLDAAVNKTTDLFFDGTNNQCNILSAGEDGLFSAEWVVYTEPVVEPNEPEYVDLGLSVNWATYNVGASAPEEVGYYVSWAELEEKESYTWDTYKYGTGAYSLTKYCKNDGIALLEAADDIATANFGSNWKTPTKAEWQELIDNCTIDYTATENGKNGVRFISNVEGYTDKSIFFPYGGYKMDNGISNEAAYADFWTSECKTSLMAMSKAQATRLSALGEASIATQTKMEGRNVRAVKTKETVTE